jgi:hypothetical protein
MSSLQIHFLDNNLAVIYYLITVPAINFFWPVNFFMCKDSSGYEKLF